MINFESIFNIDNIDDKYLNDDMLFDVNENSITPTPYFKYIALKNAKDMFKDKIRHLDKKNEFFILRSVIEVPNADIDKKMKEFSDLIELAEADIEKWKIANINYYRQQPSLPSSDIYSDVFDFNIDDDITLDEAIQGYKSCNEILKSIENKDLDKYCTSIRTMINKEHSSKYQEEKKRIYNKYNIPTKEEIKNSLPKKNVTKSRLSLDRSKSVNSAPVENFMNQVLNKISVGVID